MMDPYELVCLLVAIVAAAGAAAVIEIVRIDPSAEPPPSRNQTRY